MKQKAIATALILGWSILFTIDVAGTQVKLSRAESEKTIRKTAYEMMKAFLTQDVPVFKRHSAKRTLDLVTLTYESTRKDPGYQQELQKANITSADQFLGYFMLGHGYSVSSSDASVTRNRRQKNRQRLSHFLYL